MQLEQHTLLVLGTRRTQEQRPIQWQEGTQREHHTQEGILVGGILPVGVGILPVGEGILVGVDILAGVGTLLVGVGILLVGVGTGGFVRTVAGRVVEGERGP